MFICFFVIFLGLDQRRVHLLLCHFFRFGSALCSFGALSFSKVWISAVFICCSFIAFIFSGLDQCHVNLLLCHLLRFWSAWWFVDYLLLIYCFVIFLGLDQHGVHLLIYWFVIFLGLDQHLVHLLLCYFLRFGSAPCLFVALRRLHSSSSSCWTISGVKVKRRKAFQFLCFSSLWEIWKMSTKCFLFRWLSGVGSNKDLFWLTILRWDVNQMLSISQLSTSLTIWCMIK